MKSRIIAGLLLGLISGVTVAQNGALAPSNFAEPAWQPPINEFPTSVVEPAIRAHFGTQGAPDYHGDDLLKSISSRVAASLDASLERELELSEDGEISVETSQVITY